jgi:hypothetical protein
MVKLHRRNTDTGGFVATETQSIIAQTDFHRVAQRRKGKHFNLGSFQKSHFHKTLHQGVVAEYFNNASPFSDSQVIERRHNPPSGARRDGTHQDAGGRLAAQTEAALANLQQARTTRLEHPQPATNAQTEVRQTANPLVLPGYVSNVGPGIAVEQFERQQIVVHGRNLGAGSGLGEIQSQLSLSAQVPVSSMKNGKKTPGPYGSGFTTLAIAAARRLR